MITEIKNIVGVPVYITFDEGEYRFRVSIRENDKCEDVWVLGHNKYYFKHEGKCYKFLNDRNFDFIAFEDQVIRIYLETGSWYTAFSSMGL